MKPMGTIPYFLAAVRSLLRARSLAASSSKATWLKRARAFRTCDSSLIGSRRRPRESTYAKALLGSCARFLVLSWLIAVRFACRRYLTRRHGATGPTLSDAAARPSGGRGLHPAQPVEGDGPRRRHVEGIHLGRHRDADLEVRGGESVSAEPAAFRAEEQRDSRGPWAPGAEGAD